MSAGKRTSAIAAVCTAIALGTAAGPAQELEQVQTVFEHAMPNIAGKSLIALVVTYPPGGKSPSHRHAGSAFIYAHVLSGAIRSQVDDYLLKPADVPTLVYAIRSRLEHRRPSQPEMPLKRVSQLMRETLTDISGEWLALVKAHKELSSIRMPDRERVEHLPEVIAEMAKRVDAASDETTQGAQAAAAKHGEERARTGYTIPLIVVEMRLLQRVLSSILQRNLIRMDLSSVIADMVLVGESLQEQLEFSIRGFQQISQEAA